MSQPSNTKGKEISGKKYASLNVNQTYKGTKVESRSAAGQTRHGGLQSLGKVAQNRRLPPPANLPSLKKENLGNDPTVNLVPARSSGWGKKEKAASKPDDQTQTSQQKPQKTEQAPEISLRPNAGVGFKNQSEQGKGWSNLQTSTGSAQQPQANSFQREFPRLGGDAGGQSTQESARELDLDERGKTNESTSMQPRPNEQKWMGGHGPGQMPMGGPGVRTNGPRMDFNFPRDQQRPMFNGAHMQPPGSQFYPPFAPGMVPPFMPMMPHPYSYPYPSNRMPPPTSMNQQTRPTTTTKSEESERPATVKQEDIQNMDDDDFEDGGWAGAQEEVDYTAKLNFDESDEEPEATKKSSTKSKSDDKQSVPVAEDKDQSKKATAEGKNKEGRPDGSEEQPQGFQGQMQYRQHPQWMGGPYPPHFDPSRGPPQGYPFPPPQWMYQMPGAYRMPGMPQQGGPLPVSRAAASHGGPSPVPQGTDKTEGKDSEKPVSIERRKRMDVADHAEDERRANATAKLQALEAKIKQREEMERRLESESSSKPGRRERFDSENSDSSRGGSQRSHSDKYSKQNRETPPRFMKQNSLAKAGKASRTDADSPASSTDAADTGPFTRIMKRRDSLKSDDAGSVHSQDSWVNIPTNETGDRNESTASGKFSDMDKNTDSNAAKKLDSGKQIGREIENSKKAEDRRKLKADNKQRESTTDLKSEDKIYDKSEKTNEEVKSEAKKEVKRYDYRQDKAKGKESRTDSRSDKKDQESDSWSKSRDDRKYRGREQSSRGKDKEDYYKTDSRKDSRQEEAFSKRTEAVSDRKTEQDRKDRYLADNKLEEKGKSFTRYQDDKSRDGSRSYKSTDSSKSRPISDNFKPLSKAKAKNMAVKLTHSKEDSKDKSTEKAQQVKDAEVKKPSAWSRVVSGETTEDATESSGAKEAPQPKKTLREIQKEEEIKENEENKLIEKEQEKLKQEAKDRLTPEEDTHRQQRPLRERERGNDDRGTRRPPYDSYDDSYQDRRRRPDSYRDRKGYSDYRSKEKYGGRDEGGSSRYDKENERKRSGYEGRRSGHEDRKRLAEDRKRKHDDTERSMDARRHSEKDYVDDGVFEEKKTGTSEEKSQETSERPVDRRKYSDRGRGSRGGRVSSYVRGRGRTAFSSRPSYNRESGSTSKPGQQLSLESLSDKSHKSEPSEAQAQETGKTQSKQDDERLDKEDQKKGKENKEPERKETSQPYKKSEEYRRGSTRSRDEYYEYSDSRSRYDRRESSRGRGRGRGFSSTSATRPASKRDNFERSQVSEPAKTSRSSTTDEKDAGKREEGKTKDDRGAKDQQRDGSDFEDDDDDEYTDESDSEDKETTGRSKEKSHKGKDFPNRVPSRGRGRGRLSSRSYTERSHDDRKHDGTYKSGMPPRFQKQFDSHSEHHRGRGFPVRGSRSRGRSYPAYGTRGRGFGKPPSSRDRKTSGSRGEDARDNDVSGESDDDTFHSADGSIVSADEEAPSKEHKHHSKEYDSSKRYSTRGKYSYRSGSARGRGARGGRGGNANHFLGDRQQERVSHIDTSEWAGTLPAADKPSLAAPKSAEDKSGAKSYGESKMYGSKRQTDGRAPGQTNTTSESLSEFSEPPKKIAKSRTTEKLDIMRQFDVNNIASVVCIDDIPQNTENVEDVSLNENDDGFVQVTSRKAQKFLRERQKEEEKRKLHEEMNAKPVKKASFDAKEAASNKQGKPSKFSDHQSQRVTQGFPQSSSQITVSDVTQNQTSNAAMAAVGGWEPAQALLRGVQSVSSAEAIEVSKTATIPAPPPAINAWKRPLSFASSLASTTTTASHSVVHSVPDPKAVGTGKPNSSPAKQLPNVQTSPSSDLVHSVAPGYTEISVSDDSKLQQIDAKSTEVSNTSDARQKQAQNRKPEARKINKGTKRETAPRFQTATKNKNAITRLVNGDVSQDRKKISVTAEDVSALEVSTLKGDDRAPGKRPDGSKLKRCNSESNKEEPVSGLPALHGEQPVISFIQDDPQSKTELVNGEEKIRDDVMINERHAKVEVQSRSEDDENAKDTARSVIKSLGDDDEKNLETRSLPSSTPPLVVEIHAHAPRSNGPSSDPGKRPTIPVSHSLTQEVNEMSMKVLSAKKIWDNIPTPVSEVSVVSSSNTMNTWSEEDNTVSSSSSAPSVPSNTVESVNRESIKEHAVTQAPVAVVAAQSLNNTDEASASESVTSSGIVSKKPSMESQNNVCKVKPQQKQSQQSSIEDKQRLITSFSNAQLFQSQFSFQQPYTLSPHTSSSNSKSQQPYVMSDSTHSNAIFSQRETVHRELPSQHSQPQVPVNIHPVSQVRPTSPLSHQHQDILQPSVMLGNISNIYGTPAMQSTHQSQVLWPVISRNAIPSTSSYLSQHEHDQQSDFLNSSGSFPSTPMYMAFDQGNSSILSAQRINSQMQQTQALGLVMPQQTLRSGSMLNVMRTSQTSKESQMFNMSLSPSPFHQGNDLQLSGTSQSDMTKHVNAKPFQPSSRTPPNNAQSSNNIISHHQSQQMGYFNKLIGQPVNLQQQQSGNQQLAENRHSGMSYSDKQHGIQQLHTHSVQQPSQVLAVQPHAALQHTTQQPSAVQHQLQPLSLQQHVPQQPSGHQHFMQHHSFQGPHVAPVGPRSVQSRTVTDSPTLQSQNRITTLSPVDPNLQYIHGGSSVKSVPQTRQHSHLIQPTSHSGNIVQVMQQNQSLPSHASQTRPFIVRPSQTFPKFQQAFPGPIKRPTKTPTTQTLPINKPKQPVVPIVKTTEASQPSSSSTSQVAASSFRNEEHQKMIEETRKYFASQNKTEPKPTAVSSVITSMSSSSTISSSSSSAAQSSVTTITPTQTILARPVEKKAAEEPKPSAQKDAPVDIPAAAMLNDPSDIDAIIKSRPSLAKAFKSVSKPEKTEKTIRQNNKKNFQKRSFDKEDKPKRSEVITNSTSKVEQKAGSAQRADRSKTAQKVKTDGNSGKN